MSDETNFDDVMSAARRWYYTEVRSLAEQAIAELRLHRVYDEDLEHECLGEWIDETTDGHQFVIYTAMAGMVCAASDNDGAYEDEIGEPAPTVEAQACMAMRRDVWELLEARHDEWPSARREAWNSLIAGL